MACPQCGSELGEGAKSCAGCGWTKSRRTLWIVLGCILGFLFLVCCGAGTWFFLKMKKVGEAMVAEMVPIQLEVLHAQVVNYAKKHGKPPATLEEAAAEELVGDKGEKVKIQFQNNQKTVDMWQRPIRYSPKPDRSFELRSAGLDGQFDNADDVVEKGTLDDDLPTLYRDIEDRTRRMGEGFIRALGVDPEKMEEKGDEPLETKPAVGTGGK